VHHTLLLPEDAGFRPTAATAGVVGPETFTVLPTDGGAEVCDVFGTVTAHCSVSPLG